MCLKGDKENNSSTSTYINAIVVRSMCKCVCLSVNNGVEVSFKQVRGTNRCVFAETESQLLESLRITMLQSCKGTEIQSLRVTE